VLYELIAIGTSWGGLAALSRVLEDLPAELDQAIVIAQHRSTESLEGGLRGILQLHTDRVVRDAEDKDPIEPRHVYLAPPDYHLLVEPGWLALSTDELVQFARPSIDVLFESTADAYAERAIGIILTGANEDGAAGLARIKQRGGVAIVQDPSTSERRHMPDAALAAVEADAVLRIEEMGAFLYGLCCEVAAGAAEATPQVSEIQHG
jgi:two-component system, chemotaxis family, protein-glutamate methylesterase/glutaminase